ncbi:MULTISPECIES: ChaN family lipoprotein [Yersinia]|uniref:ChaN family lipoprotein n=1 Tax=Yersinia TaxID=629 RepID=UPI000EB1CC5D|nr:ChaN family lipoprotein [Yersinia sp. IP36721]
MRILLLFSMFLMISCTSTPPKNIPSDKSDITAFGTITDLHTGKVLTASQLVDELAGAPQVIVGEKHDNLYHHQIERWLIENLAQKRPQGSVLLEMLNPNQQIKVDKVKSWLQQEPRVRESRIVELLAWQPGWSWALYGDLAMTVMRAPYPVWSANLDRDEIMAIYKEKPPLEGKLSTTPEVRAALEKLIRASHDNKIDASQLASMVAIQQQRDRRMAERLLAAPTPTLLIAGGYHAAKNIGVPLHMQDLKAASHPLVLMLAEEGANVGPENADYLWSVPVKTLPR